MMMQLRQVALADLESSVVPRGWFAPRPGETNKQFKRRVADRVRDHAARAGADEGKARRYGRKKARGDQFPPIFVVELAGRMSVMDGWHRTNAAALAGDAYVPAMVATARDGAEEGALLEEFWALCGR